MENISQPDTSGNTPTYDYNGLSEHQKALPAGTGQDFAAGYCLFEPDEIDPNPGEPPPDFRDETQAALHAQLRGFEVLQLQPDGAPVDPHWRSAATSDPAIIHKRWADAPRCKVGAITSGLIVLSVSREGFKQIEALAAGKRPHTAAVHSYVDESAVKSAPIPCLIFRLPDGIRSPEENISLAPGVDVLPDDGYIELPGGATDTCYWFNRRPIAMAPQWLVDKLAALAASQTERSEVMGAGAAAMEAFRKGQLSETGAPPIAVLPSGSDTPETNEPVEIADAKQDEKDTSEIPQQAVPARPAPAANPPPIEPAVAERETDEAPAKSSRYDEAFDWINSDHSPGVTDANRREVLPRMATALRRQFDISLTEATADRAPAPTAKPAGNTEMAIGFLDGLDPSGRHDLATFDPPDCATFLFPNEREEARRWTAARQSRKSIYVSVNRAREDVARNKRLDHKKKKEIGLIRAITADIDIPDIKSDDLNEKRQHFQRLKTKLLEEVVPKLAKLECPPALVVDSGGGVQLWWPLKKPVPATPDNSEKAEGIGRAVSELLQANFPEYKLDNVSDLARVMRLPGTINVPNATKRKRGRLAAPTTVLTEHCSRDRYSLDELAAWVPPTAKRRSKSSKSSNEEFHAIEKELNAQWGVVCAANWYDELPADLREKFESARERDPALQDVWNGNPIRGQKDESPSGFMFAFAERLVRASLFTAIEFGQLLWVCEDIYPDNDPVKINPRTLSRAWGKKTKEHAALSSASGFEGVQIDETKRPRLSAKAKSESGESEHTKAESKGAAWDEPADLWADAADPPDLALGVLPPALERWVKDEAERKGVDLGVMAVPAVVACAAAIPAQFQLQVKQADTGHKTRGILWGVLVGDPGVRKSPVLGAAMAPIEAAEVRWKERNQKANAEFQQKLAAYKRSVKDGGDEPEPSPPKPLRKIIMDATTEALGPILNDNPAGLLEYQDELSQWIGSMDAYRANKPVSRDQGFWLAAKEGRQSSVDRTGRGTLAVEVTAIHVLGGIQPSVVRKVASEWGGNGLMQRFLLVMAKTARRGIDRAPDGEASETIHAAVSALMDLEWSPFVPVFRLSREADEWRQKVLSFANGLINQPDLPWALRGWFEKMEGEWARLCLVFHFIEWATGTRATPFPPEVVTAETAIRAARFLIEFQYPHQKEFYRSVGLVGENESDARSLAEHILAHRLTEIDERRIERARSHLRGPTKRAARLQLAQALADGNWLRPIGEHRTAGHVNRWSVHPAVHDRFAAKAEAEAARLEDIKESIDRAAEVRRALRRV